MCLIKLFKKKSKKKVEKKSWYDITLGQYQRLNGLDFNDVGDLITAAEILLGINADDMLWKDFCMKLNELNFLTEPMPETIVRTSYKLNGRKYNCMYNLQEMSVARYMDFTNLVKNNDLVKILGVFLVPDGKEYGEYDIDQVYDDIRTMSVVEAYGIFNFFKVQFIVCIKTMKDYSVKMLKKDKRLQRVVSELMESYSMSDLL